MNSYIEQIIRYFFRHDVSDEIAARVQDRLASAGDEADRAFRELWDECAEAPADDDALTEAYQQLTAGMPVRTTVGRRFSWLRIAALWAVPLLLLGGAAWFYTSATKKADLYAGIVSVHQFTAYGERRMVVLPDSSKVWLNGGSSLTYPSRFVSAERNVCLTGEAYFEVVKDPQRPFTVDVNQMKLCVLGTTFNVFSYPDNPEIVATLETGKLRVDVTNRKEPYILTPDNQLVLNAQTGHVEVRQVHAPDYSVWRIPSLYFEETKLVYALQQIERTYNVRIHIQNSRYNHQTIRAHFNADETIENIMAVIKMLIPSLNYEIDGNDIFIR